ncbi:MAG: SDR family oxidoreductase [Pseudonocardiaceae bacterium]
MTSVGAHRAHRYHVGYEAASAGVESVVRTLALEYGSRLSVRAFALGPLAESTSTTTDGEALPALVRLVPLGRYARLAEVAEAIALFGGQAFDLASPRPCNHYTHAVAEFFDQIMDDHPERRAARLGLLAAITELGERTLAWQHLQT